MKTVYIPEEILQDPDENLFRIGILFSHASHTGGGCWSLIGQYEGTECENKFLARTSNFRLSNLNRLKLCIFTLLRIHKL